jgi:4-diphosphocytidyl-2-C-methyl-D-erythritol kinase
MDLAAELGSDVSFFLGSGPALCRGRGERIEPVAGLPRMFVVVARPSAGLSTARVYAHSRPADAPQDAERLIRLLRAGDLAAAGGAMLNRLQTAAERLSPEAAQLARELELLDVWATQMSGSGTSYFALCRSARHAQGVASRLRTRNVGVVFAAATENQT